jgi:hypothetical protein
MTRERAKVGEGARKENEYHGLKHRLSPSLHHSLPILNKGDIISMGLLGYLCWETMFRKVQKRTGSK